MKPFSRRVVGTCAAVFLAVGGHPAARANVQFNFNATQEGWTFGQETTPQSTGTVAPGWTWVKAPSKLEGGLQAFVSESGSAVGAWALSPCLEIFKNENQEYVHVDIAHWTKFPEYVLGQVQFRVDVTGSGWGPWQGISGTSWLTTNHVPPTASDVFPPLLSSTATIPGPNVYLAFSGTNYDSGNPQGPHVLSGFDIQWADTGLSAGKEIQFRLLMGVNADVPLQPAELLWEVNSIQIDGVKLCAVPEPASLVLATVGGLGCLGMVCRRRRHKDRRSPARAPIHTP